MGSLRLVSAKDLGGKKMAGSKVSGFLLLFLVAHLAHGRDLELAPGGQGILSRIKSLQPTVPCQAYTAVMRSAIELGELPNEFECIGIERAQDHPPCTFP